MKVIINTNVILEDGIIYDGAVAFNDGKIVYVGKEKDIPLTKGVEIIDAKGLYTAPGLIDIHNHGTEKYLFTDKPSECCEFFVKHGITTVLPTLYCNLTAEQMIEGAKRIREATETGAGEIIGGLYMEGPYMNGEGSNQKYILWGGDIVEKQYVPVVKSVCDIARIWAIDPARKGISEFMEKVKKANPEAIFALGHSHATFQECKKVYKYGVKVQTHHGDSGKAKGLAQGTIGAGCDEFTLYNPEMYAEIICDEVGVHLPADMIKTVVRTKGVERIILISDSMPKSGEYKNNEAEGIAYGPDLNYDYEGHLAGSHLTLDRACRNVMAHTGYGLCHAIRFASINPAKLLGIDNEVGSIDVGKKANLILIDDKINVKKVYFEGELF